MYVTECDMRGGTLEAVQSGVDPKMMEATVSLEWAEFSASVHIFTVIAKLHK